MKLNNQLSAVTISFLFCICLSLIVNCGCNGSDKVDKSADAANEQTGAHGVGHTHESGDELVWPVKEKSPDKSLVISYGHHGKHFHAGEKIEPAISILKDNVSIADAVVSVGLVETDGKVADFIETVYEPESKEELAHYAQGELAIPNEGTEMTIRYRIVLKSGKEFERDVTIAYGTH